MTEPVGVHYVSYGPGGGYGDAAVQYIAGLRSRGIPVTWTSEDLPRGASLHPDTRADEDYDTVLIHLPPQCFASRIEPDTGILNVGYSAWESDRVPDFWREAIDDVDLLLVPSQFNARAVLQTGTTTPVAVLPHIARRVRPIPSGRFGEIGEEDFVFYTMGPWYNRKAVPETIRAFLDSFTADDDVALIVKTSPMDYASWTSSASSLARILDCYRRPPIVVLHSDEASTEEIDQIHTRADCFVSLTRGEGFGLGSFDAALFGNPSIITGWGGHVEYLGAAYDWLVDYTLIPTTADEPDAYRFPLDDGAHWARADSRHAGALMRQAYEDREQTAARGAKLAARLADEHAPILVTSRLVGLMGR